MDNRATSSTWEGTRPQRLLSSTWWMRWGKRITDPQEQVIFISHSDCLEDAKVVGEEASAAWREGRGLQSHRPRHRPHTGPGTVASLYGNGAVIWEDIKWLEVAADTTTQELEDLSARLTMNGVTGLVIEDEGRISSSFGE